jgi:hypothetical protein
VSTTSHRYHDKLRRNTIGVADLIDRMTLEEKAANLDAGNPGVPRLGVPSMVFGESLHAVNSGCGDTVPLGIGEGLGGDEQSTGCATVFPQVVGSVVTFAGVSIFVRGMVGGGGHVLLLLARADTPRALG